MKIEIQIKNSGCEVGTTGWLAKNAKSIVVGTTKAGRQAAWLQGKDGQVLECLCVRDYWNQPEARDEITSLQRTGCADLLVANYAYTDAGWAVMEEIIEIALENIQEGDSEKTYSVEEVA